MAAALPPSERSPRSQQEAENDQRLKDALTDVNASFAKKRITVLHLGAWGDGNETLCMQQAERQEEIDMISTRRDNGSLKEKDALAREIIAKVEQQLEIRKYLAETNPNAFIFGSKEIGNVFDVRPLIGSDIQISVEGDCLQVNGKRLVRIEEGEQKAQEEKKVEEPYKLVKASLLKSYTVMRCIPYRWNEEEGVLIVDDHDVQRPGYRISFIGIEKTYRIARRNIARNFQEYASPDGTYFGLVRGNLNEDEAQRLRPIFDAMKP